ncbi:hypothetical protein HDU98_007161 [Podochytrium sp. JEL0797]|nr:hypothetical protein HDU98_007161 [Podochytrium sp. JEL0797]
MTWPPEVEDDVPVTAAVTANPADAVTTISDAIEEPLYIGLCEDLDEANLTLPKRTDTPRGYQRFVFDHAKTQNTIVVLPTGSGKTLISLLLIKHVHEIDYERGMKRISVFLAPQIPLVSQQTNYLRQNCDFKVRMYHGELGVDGWTQEAWEAEFKEFGCMVMTPAILEMLLRRRFIALKEINLIVFDECHHARKNSTYNQIIALHYIPSPDDEKPLLFGMTASPLNGKGSGIDLSIKQLETNLCCKAITPDSHSDLKHHVTTPAKTIVVYEPVQTRAPPLLACLQGMGIADVPQLKQLLSDAIGIWEDFGGWVADAFLKSSLEGIFASHRRQTQKALEEGNGEDLAAVGNRLNSGLQIETRVEVGMEMELVEEDYSVFASATAMDGVLYGNQMQIETEFGLDKTANAKLSHIKFQNFVKAVAEMLEKESAAGSLLCPDVASFSFQDSSAISPSLFEGMSSKFKKLLSILEAYASDTLFCGIVFTEKRSTAKIMSLILPRSPRMGFVKSDCLMGHGGMKQFHGKRHGGINQFSMEVRNQRRVVGDFKGGALNLLTATKVAEEGIDIQPCNLVVRFDNVTTVISNIQSRGRARHKDSNYVLMVSSFDLGTIQRIKQLEVNEAKMNDLLQDRTDQDSSVNDPLDHSISVSDETFFQIKSGAKLSVFNAISVIHQYCDLLPHDSFANLSPIFNTGPCLLSSAGGEYRMGWISSLQLPANAPSTCRYISGKPSSSRTHSKRLVALEAIKHLYAAGSFNEHLKLNRYDIGPVNGDDDLVDAKRAAMGVKKVGGNVHQVTEYETMLPRLFLKTFPCGGGGGGSAPDSFGGSNGGLSGLESMDPVEQMVVEPQSSLRNCRLNTLLEESMERDSVLSRPPANDGVSSPPDPGAHIASTKRSQLPVSTEGYLTLLRLDGNDHDRMLDIALLLAFKLSDDAIKNHVIVINKQPRRVTLMSSSIPIRMDADRNDAIQKFSDALFFNALLRTPPPVSDPENEYLILVVPLISGEEAALNLHDAGRVDGLVDWRMLAAVSVHEGAVLKHPVLEGKDQGGEELVESQPRLEECAPNFVHLFDKLGDDLVVGDSAYWNRKYQVVDVLRDATPFSIKENGFDSVASFYKLRLRARTPVLADQPVLLALPLPHMHQSGKMETSNQHAFVHLIPQFCTPFPISASLMAQAVFVPPIIQSVYHRLSTLEIRQALNLSDASSPAMFQAAFTSSGTQFAENYERLEFLGDSFLKMQLSLHLFVHHPSKDEGWLTRSRMALERNKHLLKISVRRGLPNALIPGAISRKTWRPPMRVQQAVKVSDKAAADIVEAVIGACVVSPGADAGSKAVKAFFGDAYEDRLEGYLGKLSSSGISGSIDSELGLMRHLLVDQLHEKLGYRFKNTKLAIEAVTHTSAIGIFGSSSCFQRLEFLGDAILGYLVSVKLYHLPQLLSPGELSNLKSELVNNQFLAVAADVLEALIGAVTLDSGGLDAAQSVIERVLVEPWWDLMAPNEAADISNPVRDMHLFADSKKCDAFFIRSFQVPGEEKFCCSIEKHERVIAQCFSTSKRLAKRMAAAEAAEAMKDAGVCECECR